MTLQFGVLGPLAVGPWRGGRDQGAKRRASSPISSARPCTPAAVTSIADSPLGDAASQGSEATVRRIVSQRGSCSGAGGPPLRTAQGRLRPRPLIPKRWTRPLLVVRRVIGLCLL